MHSIRLKERIEFPKLLTAKLLGIQGVADWIKLKKVIDCKGWYSDFRMDTTIQTQPGQSTTHARGNQPTALTEIMVAGTCEALRAPNRSM
jgi:hypothetical protein